MRQLNIQTVTWPAAGEFRISRSALTAFPMVQVEIIDGLHRGRGECRPYARYDETPQNVTAQIETIRAQIESGLCLDALQSALPAGAARNAVDCALWDLKAKTESRSVWEMLGLPKPKPRVTAYTLSLDTPAKMADAAVNAAQYPVLKIKIAGVETLDCVTAILGARPDAKLIIDANEALDLNSLSTLQARIPDGTTLLIEQPLPASEKGPFAPALSPPICADEALHTRQDLDALWAQGYRAVNIKLDKCGGLTEGLLLAQQAKTMGFTIMAGCMVGSSLAMAPMVMLESFAEVIDLDGPLLLSEDIENGLRYDGPTVYPPTPELWG